MTALVVRPPAVAGAFYPASPTALAEALEESFGAAQVADGPMPHALVAPHAGYVYSGPVAGSAYLRLAGMRDSVRRVVLLGPSHRVPLRGIAVSGADAFATPLGLVPVDTAGRRAALEHDVVTIDDGPHAGEHSLEVHLPFLQTMLDRFELLPLAVGHVDPSRVADVLDSISESISDGLGTLIVVSTDLSHYLPYDEACVRDRRTADAITTLDVDGIADGDACGAYPLRGLLLSARRAGLTVEELDVRNSGDTSGDPDRVVGYGSFALS